VSEQESRPIVLDDSWVWYAKSETRQELLRQRFEDAGCRYLGEDEIVSLATRLLDSRLCDGDIVVVPLMSGALLLPAIDAISARVDIRVLIAPLSKHPFVTLSGDDDLQLHQACRWYERRSISFMEQEMSRTRFTVPRRVVVVDASTAAGRDAELFFHRVARRRWAARDLQFFALVNAIGHDESSAPGSPPEAKIRRPDASAITARLFDPLYVSHLRFMARSEPARAATAALVRSAFPRLTQYWDDDADGDIAVTTAAAHARDSSRDRTHARTPRSAGAIAEELFSILVDVERESPVTIDVTALTRRRWILGSHASVTDSL
jgi:hypothetical protein